jgi:hypothetical protein
LHSSTQDTRKIKKILWVTRHRDEKLAIDGRESSQENFVVQAPLGAGEQGEYSATLTLHS